jgi:hypothetical protein
MIRRSWFTSFAMFLTAVGLSSSASGVVTPQVLINFDGTLTGATYNLAPGELDLSGSFSANGTATVAGGLGVVSTALDSITTGPGNAEGIGPGTGSGFFFMGTFLGPLTSQSWVSEAQIQLNLPPNAQPGQFNHFLDVQGDTFWRMDSPPNKVTRFGYWDGSDEPTAITPDLSTTNYSHVALVWNAANSTLEGFFNGVSQGVLDGGNFDVSSPRVGYGFFARFYNRAVDSTLDAVAFSFYDGAFNPATDFQLEVVPEPSVLALLSCVFVGMMGVRRK